MRKLDTFSVNEIHEFGINIVLDDIRTNGYTIASVTTAKESNPQIVAHKGGQLIHIVVRTDVYPKKGVIENFQLGLQILDFAYSNNAVCYFASVGIANADGSTDLEMSTPTHDSDYFVAYSGIEELTPTKVRAMTRSYPSMPTYNKDGMIAGSVTKGGDGKYTITAKNGADVSALIMSLFLIIGDGRDLSNAQKIQFSLWAHLPTNEWTEIHQNVFAQALLHYFMEVKANSGVLPQKILKGLENIPPQALVELRYPLNKEIRVLFASLFAG